jgi:hypothetical protein
MLLHLREEIRMKVRSAIGLVAALAVVGVLATPSGAGTPTTLRITLTATVTGAGGNCCFSENFFQGTGAVPRIGPATFTGNTLVGCTPFDPSTCTRLLSIDVVGRNGRTLSIDGSQFWSNGDVSPPQTWTATGSGFTGSGTYQTTPDTTFELDVGTQITIELTGTLQPA